MCGKVCGHCLCFDDSKHYCLMHRKAVGFSDKGCQEFHCDGSSCFSECQTYEFWRVEIGDAVIYFDTRNAAVDYIDNLRRVAKALKTTAPDIDVELIQFSGELSIIQVPQL